MQTSRQRSSRVGTRRVALGGALLLALTGCVDLQVDNISNADRERAIANPNDVLAFIGGAYFPTMHSAMNVSLAVNLFPYASSEMTSSLNGTQDVQQARDLLEPRVQHNNGSHISQGVGPHGPRNYWAEIGRAANIPYETLRVLAGGMTLTENNVDATARARAFAKFMQGWAWGNAALIFDEVHIVDETQELPANPEDLLAFAAANLVSYQVGIAKAVEALQAAATIAQQNPGVTFPGFNESFFWFGTPTAISNAQFIQMANTLSARFLVLAARTPQERAQVDWPRVLQYTANGVTADVRTTLNQQRQSNYLQRIQNNTTGGTANGRWDYRTIGPADQSGAYQAWIAKPAEERTRFNIVTPDRRITGATPTSNGSYTRYRADNNGFPTERGTYFQSAYQWGRHSLEQGLSATQPGQNSGTMRLISVDENNLFRAEALLRTGNPAGAATLINISRTRTHLGSSLPPVTAAGVPTVGGVCVPRRENGSCGDLLTAIRYERMIELAGMDMIRGYADSRGFGIMADGSLLSWPVPGNVLELYGLPARTYGGVGAPGTATFAPATLP